MILRRLAESAAIFILPAAFAACERSVGGRAAAGTDPLPVAKGDTPQGSQTSPQVVASTPRGVALLADARALFVGLHTEASLQRPVLRSDVDGFVADGALLRALIPSQNGREPIVRLPRSAEGFLSIESTGVQATVRPLGFAASVAEWAEHVAVYPNVAEHTHEFRRVSSDGVEDLYQVDVPRDELSFAYDVALSGVEGVRVIDGSVELIDASGTPRLRAPNPTVFDAKGTVRSGIMVVSGCAYDTNPMGPWGRKIVAPGASHCTVTASVDGRGLSYPVLVDPAWTTTFNTKQTHAFHKLLYLPAGPDKGKVLLAGGTGSLPAQTELYNPATESWASASTLLAGPSFGQGCNAAVLPSGTVVLTGGYPVGSTFGATSQPTVLVRDPNTGTWSGGAVMSSGRAWHTLSVVSASGKPVVLAVGGELNSGTANKTAEYYDEVTDSWKSAGTLSVPKTKHTAAVMADGRVLIAGGATSGGYAPIAVNSALIWDAALPGFTAAGFMAVGRMSAVSVGVGKGVIVAGGRSAMSDNDSIENYDGTSWTLLSAKMGNTRVNFAGTKLDDGRVLFTGGQIYNATVDAGIATSAADLFSPGSDPKTGSVVSASTMSTQRAAHAAVLLPGIGALVTGGQLSNAAGSETTISELYKTTIGGPCPCPSSLTCVDAVCCAKSSCAAGERCDNPSHEGVCTKALGAKCTNSTECATGYCVTGVCCESACSGVCKTCDDPSKPGVCVLTPLGTDPSSSCGAGGDFVCARKCDGFGACGTVFAPLGTPCGTSASDGGASFCAVMACGGWGRCEAASNKCGLSCIGSDAAICDEATKSCSPSASTITAGHCVIDKTCWSFGDLNPKDKCAVCDPPTSKLAWSVAASCVDAGVDAGAADTMADGAGDDASQADTAEGDADSSTDDATPDADDDASDGGPAGVRPELVSGRACVCTTTVGSAASTSTSTGLLAWAGVAIAAAARQRRKSASRRLASHAARAPTRYRSLS
ncbi:MAG: hypothetical protein NVSMB1_02520 [Polyangiales bacterium]